MRAPAARLLLLLALAALGACSRRPVPFGYRGELGPDLEVPDGPRHRELGLDARRDGEPVVHCTPGTRLTYVIDDTGKLYHFDPTAATPISPAATLSCPLPGHPYSMAVRHDGIGYIVFSSGSFCSGLARVDVSTMSCTKVAAFDCDSTGVGLFGMSFAVYGPAGEETLFIAGTSSPWLETLDPETGKVKVKGALPSSGIELAGNTKGELWAFTPDPTAEAYRLDPSNALVLQQFSLPIDTTDLGQQSWAFVAWGGAFYIFFGDAATGGTSVYRLTSDGKLTTLLSKTGMNIVGAGSAVCAGT
jgi:hypothetical protein